MGEGRDMGISYIPACVWHSPVVPNPATLHHTGIPPHRMQSMPGAFAWEKPLFTFTSSVCFIFPLKDSDLSVTPSPAVSEEGAIALFQG